ncbi:MAG: GDSL-type esterase/lipase family protein, partial [Victivallales bacterium]
IAAWENPELAAESLEHIVQLYSERGPAHGPTQRNLIIPIVYCRTIELTGNLDLARRTWPAMMEFMRFWFADRGDGIPWRDGNSDGLIDSGSSLEASEVSAGTIVSNAMDETGYDEIPTYSAGFTDKRRGMLADNVEFDWKSKCLTVSLICQNSLYVASCKKMSLLASSLGDDSSRKWLDSEAARVSGLIAGKLFDKSHGYFMNRHWNGDFSPVKTVTIFFPLLTGLPDTEVRERLRKALLDPKQFWGDNLVPIVSRDEPSYKDGIDSNGNYWRGNCWAPTTYMCWLSAREAGWYDISALIAEKVTAQFMKYWTSLGHAYENYPAEGDVDNSYIYAGGAWGGREIRYVWTALMPLCLLEEIFAVEPVGGGFQFGNPFLSQVSEWNGFLCHGSKVYASAGSDITKVVFGDEWSFESKPGLAVRNFSISAAQISFRTQPLWRDALIRIKSKAVHPGKIPRDIVNGRECSAVSFAEDGVTLLVNLRGMGGKWFQVAVIGDSIVHGGCDSELGGWVARLRLHCSRNGLGDHVFDLGLGGNNSRDLLARAESDIRSRLHHTDIIIFGTGTNDMNKQSYVAPDEFRSNLEKMAVTATGLGKKVAFVGLTVRKDMPPETSAKYDSIIKDVCEKGGYLYFPLMDVINKDDLSDSCHPNARGHEKICARVLETLQVKGLI